MTTWTAVILSGGRGSRLGTDKTAAVVAGRTLLQRVVDSVPREVPLVISGPVPPAVGRRCEVVREDPPGGGPAVGLVAALPLVGTPTVVVLAADLPFLADLPAQLARRLDGRDALLAMDGSGEQQPLLAAYRTAALRGAVDRIGDTAGVSMRRLLQDLRVAHLRLAAATVDPALDVDTPADLARARGAAMLQDWIDAVRIDLGTTGEFDIDMVLDVAKDVAHNVQRPAAPLSTYLLGLAVGAGMPLQEAADKVRELASGWVADER